MGTALALPQIVEILAPGGEYETGRVALRRENLPIVEAAKKVTAIETAEDDEAASQLGRLLQAAGTQTEAFFKTYKTQIDALKRPILDAEKSDYHSYEIEKKRLAELHLKYVQKCRAEQAEKDRLARLEAEREAQEAALLRAIELESVEGTEAAEQALEEPLYVPPVVTSSRFVKAPGSVIKWVYKAEVENFMEMVKAVADGKLPLAFLTANQSLLDNQAKSLKDAFYVPGCKLKKYEDAHWRS